MIADALTVPASPRQKTEDMTLSLFTSLRPSPQEKTQDMTLSSHDDPGHIPPVSSFYHDEDVLTPGSSVTIPDGKANLVYSEFI